MNSIAQKYNRFLILIFALAPFVAFFTFQFLNLDFNRIMQLFSYLGVFLILVLRNKEPINFPKYLLFYLLFIIYVFYSDLYRLNRDFKFSYLFSNRLIGSLLMMFVIENINVPINFYKNILAISKYILIIAVIVIIIQQVYNPDFFMRMDRSEMIESLGDSKIRLYSIYSWFGYIFAAGFSFVPIFFLVLEDMEKRKKKIVLWLMIGLVFVFLTKQRWVMLNFLMIFIILIIHNKDRLFRILKLLVFFPILIISLFIVLDSFGIKTTKIIKERILESDKTSINRTSAGTRILAIYAFNRLYWDNPIFGIGNIKYGMGGTGRQDYKLRAFLKGRSSQIHVGYLSLLYMYGFVGGVIFLSFLFLILKKLYINARIHKMWAPFFGILGVAIDNFVDVNLNFFYMGLLIALFADRYYMQQIMLRENKLRDL